jgi:hypothetical protein
MNTTIPINIFNKNLLNIFLFCYDYLFLVPIHNNPKHDFETFLNSGLKQ